MKLFIYDFSLILINLNWLYLKNNEKKNITANEGNSKLFISLIKNIFDSLEN